MTLCRWWCSIHKRLPGSQLGIEPVEIGVAVAPLNLGKTKIQVSQCAAYGYIRQRVVHAHAKGLFSQALIHGLERSGYLVVLAFNPLRAALALRTLVFLDDGDGGVKQTIS